MAACVSILVRPLLAASVIAVAPIASNAEMSPFVRSYGDTVEIVLPQSPTGVSTIRPSVPSENVTIVNLHDGTTLFEDSPCRSEPLVARRITGGLFETSLGSRSADELVASGVSPRFFHLSPTLPDSVDPGEALSDHPGWNSYGHVRQFDVDNSVLQNRVSPQNRFDPVDFTQGDEGRIAIHRPRSLHYPEGTRGQLDRLRTGG